MRDGQRTCEILNGMQWDPCLLDSSWGFVGCALSSTVEPIPVLISWPIVGSCRNTSQIYHRGSSLLDGKMGTARIWLAIEVDNFNILIFLNSCKSTYTYKISCLQTLYWMCMHTVYSPWFMFQLHVRDSSPGLDIGTSCSLSCTSNVVLLLVL